MNRRTALIAGLAAAGAAVVVIAIIASSGGFGRGGRHVVPDLRGQRLDLAQDRLDRIGLDSDTQGGGTFGVVVRSHWRVCKQNPLPGKEAREVLLVVDRECEWPVPDVVGRTLKQARKQFGRAGTPYVVADYTSPRRPGDDRYAVCQEDPEYGPTSATVVLTVNRTCELPDLTGLAVAEAVQKLSPVGVAVAAFTDSGHRVWSGGWHVCAQNVAAGDPADKVKLSVNRTCELPDVGGLSLPLAIGKLKRAGVAVKALTRAGRRVPKGAWWVCDQDPSAYGPADSVLLTVDRSCRGDTIPANPSSAALPYVEGYSLDLARAQFDAVGVFSRLVVSRDSRGLDSSLLEVCHQEPRAGASLPDGGSAVLYVAGDCYSEWPGGFRK